MEHQDVQDTLNCCVFWPTWVHDEIEDEPIHKEACETHVAGNNTFLAVWCDKKHGAPPNTITSTKVVWTFSHMHRLTAGSRLLHRKRAVRDANEETSKPITGFEANRVKKADGSSAI